MGFVCVNAAEILLIRRIEERELLVQNILVFLLENFSVHGVDFVPVLVVLAVFGYFVDKKQRQRLDAAVIQFLFLFEMGAYGFPDLHPAKVRFRYVADHFPGVDGFPVGKRNRSFDRVNRADAVAAVLLHIL